MMRSSHSESRVHNEPYKRHIHGTYFAQKCSKCHFSALLSHLVFSEKRWTILKVTDLRLEIGLVRLEAQSHLFPVKVQSPFGLVPVEGVMDPKKKSNRCGILGNQWMDGW